MLKKILMITAAGFLIVYVQASEKLILVNSATFEGLAPATKYIEANGVWIKHIYPPSVMIVDEKNSGKIQNIHGIAGIYTDKIESSVISSLTGSAKIGALAWNENLDNLKKAPAAPAVLPAYFFNGSDCLIPSDYNEVKYKSPGFLGKVLPEPSASLTSGYLIGKVAVCLVFPQANGVSEPVVHTWTSGEIGSYTSAYQSEMNKFAAAETRAGITFIYENKTIPVDYEPANYGSSNISVELAGVALWMPQVLTALGVSGQRAYCNTLQKTYNADWAYMDFEVEASGGRSYAYFGGPYTVNYNHMAGAHEAVHIFWGQDEYLGNGNSNATTTSGYYGTVNSNYLGAVEPNCIMLTGTGTTFCTATRAQLGWVDLNANSTMDLLEVNPSGTVTLGSKILTGTARAGTPVPVPSDFGPCDSTAEGFTMKNISTVSYRVDGGDWIPAAAADGKYDSAYEPYTFYPTAEQEASTHTLDIRFSESLGLSTTISTTVGSLDVLTSVNRAVCYPTPFNPRNVSGAKLNIDTGAANQSFTVSIYSVSGEKIRTLSQAGTEIDTETGFASWDGKNAAGEEVASGMYFVVASSGSKTAKGKLLVKKK
ncbi:MAG: T9SS type A sorting domain-containing protein [Candidatus Firestonebacteria bacterium]